MSAGPSTSRISGLSRSDSVMSSFAFRCSLETARARLERASASAATSAATPVASATTPTPPAETFGHGLERTSRAPRRTLRAARATTSTTTANTAPPQPWRHRLTHTSSICVPRSLAARKQAYDRREEAQTFRAKAKTFATTTTASIKSAAGRYLGPLTPGSSSATTPASIRGRPITIVRNTAHKMDTRDYEAWEHGPSRREHFAKKAKEDGVPLEEWCRRAGLSC